MKRVFYVLAVLVLIGIGGYFWWNTSLKPVDSGNEEVQSFLILKGSSASSIGNNLAEAGLVRSSLAFKFYAQLTGKQKKIQAGEFDLSPGQSLIEIVDRLNKGPKEIWVTIPEGMRQEEVVEIFVSAFDLTSEKATEFRLEFLRQTIGDEGYLFPDTYLFPRTATASVVARKLRNTFDAKISSDLADAMEMSDLGFAKTVILASLLERETITDEERPVVAGILLKRLNADWPLQVDAAVQYAVGDVQCRNSSPKCDWWPILTRADLDINSPFNTYKYPGLPPDPIASPGLSSIAAVVNFENSPYWYYIHDPKGKIHYAETLEQHNSNIAKYLGK